MPKKNNFADRIIVGITGFRDIHWKRKMEEVEKLKLSEVALFLESFNKEQRERIYKALLGSRIKKIPLVHIRNDMKKEELVFLRKNFGTVYFTIHEDGFKFIKEWREFYKYLFLEMNNDDFVSKFVRVDKIGGFCVDLAHFKMNAHKNSEELKYVLKRKNTARYFACNHLSGYSLKRSTDLHWAKDVKDFDYLASLPRFLFGKVIAVEIYNSIADQLKFKKYLLGIINKE